MNFIYFLRVFFCDASRIAFVPSTACFTGMLFVVVFYTQDHRLRPLVFFQSGQSTTILRGRGCLLLSIARPGDNGNAKGVGTGTNCVIHTHFPTFSTHAKMGKAPGWA